MTETERAHLLELGRELSGALQSPWEPGTISRAFATRGTGEVVLTMQGWIDLDAARSPLLLGDMPSSVEELDAAYAAFGLVFEGASGEEAAGVADAMLAEVRAAFAAVLPMRPEQAGEEEGNDGFGDFAPILACLISQLGLSRAEALDTPVAQAFVLVAAHRRNQGWQVAGKKYAFRDLGETESEVSSQKSEEEGAT